jgi:2-dehydro-3-deoxyphosphooctonate aldolase (KDO 8-P synthase)
MSAAVFSPASAFTVIAGPCVIESEQLVMDIAREVKALGERRGVEIIFKASYDKANRTSIESFRGPGLQEGLRILSRVRDELGLRVTTDFHEPGHAARVAEAVDVLQVPAFLSRQTDMLVAAARTGRAVNVKKGQFLAPPEVSGIVDKLRGAGASDIAVTERGTSFGYHRLVVDFSGVAEMRQLCPVVFDATHSVQLPGSLGSESGGRRESVRDLALAAAAVGVDALFVEVHPEPDRALSDAASSIPVAELDALVADVMRVRSALRGPSGTGGS